MPNLVETRLARSFGEANVSSASGVAFGADELRAVRDSVRSADVVIALVRPSWAELLGAPDNLERLALTEALACGVPIVSVLINDTSQPDPSRLPEELRCLLHARFRRIEAGSGVLTSIDELIEDLHSWLMSLPSEPDSDCDAPSVPELVRVDDAEREQRRLAADELWSRAEALVDERNTALRAPGSVGGTAWGAGPDPVRPASDTVAAADVPDPRPAAPPAAGAPPSLDPVRLGVSAPKHVGLDQEFTARLVAYGDRQDARARRLLRGPRRRASARLDVARSRWPRGATVEVRLSGDDLLVARPSVLLTWHGEPLEFAFGVRLKPTTELRCVVLRFEVIVNGVPLAHPHLELDVGSPVQRLLDRVAARTSTGGVRVAESDAPTSAFASYSSKDRLRVLDGIGALESIGVDVFTDCLDIHAGEEFKSRILRELLDRDLYVLFWSHNARDSSWVAWELDTVLDKRGEAPIRLSPLEPDVTPPPRLSHINVSWPGVWVSAYGRQSS